MACMWNVLPAHAFKTLGPQMVVLSWEVMDLLGGVALLKRVCHWGTGLWGCSLIPLLNGLYAVSKQPHVFHMLATATPQLWVVPEDMPFPSSWTVPSVAEYTSPLFSWLVRDIVEKSNLHRSKWRLGTVHDLEGQQWRRGKAQCSSVMVCMGKATAAGQGVSQRQCSR